MDLVDAFLTGYAHTTTSHDVGLTPRAVLACQAAFAVGEASPQPDPRRNPKTPTIQLGQLEGIWAVIYARREAIEKAHADGLGVILDHISDLDWGSVVDQVERWLLLDPGMTGKMLTAKLGADIESMIASRLSPKVAGAWRDLMHQALVDATAEGRAAALGLVAQSANVTIDWNLAADEAKQALAGDQVLWDSSSGWIAKQTHGLGYQIGQKLASLWNQGASRDEMEQAIQDLLGNVSKSAAGTILDTAIGQSLSVGALDTYQTAGVIFADYETAGDGRVCADCGDAEDNSPYPLYDAPIPPLHVSCRCTLSPSDFQPTGPALQLISGYTAGSDAAAEMDD